MTFATGYSGEKQRAALKDTVDHTIWLKGWVGDPDSIPEADTDTLSRSQFLKYRNNYHDLLLTDPRRILPSDSSYEVRTCCARLHYLTEKILMLNTSQGSHRIHGAFSRYQGRDPRLRLYFFEAWDVGEFEIGSNFMIDSLTNICYRFEAHSDAPFPPPAISADHKRLAFYMSDEVMYEPPRPPSSDIYVIGVRDSAGVNYYEEYTTLKVTDKNIKELLWINDTTLALHVEPDWQSHIEHYRNDHVTVSSDQYIKVYLRPRREEGENK
ncbi:MAG: hypothetical protein JSS76_19325 [Bacteroidetes bacterium]|nr:hypothetical protein [Bacteroidota bacterium]